MSNERNWSVLLRRLFLVCFCFFVFLFYFLDIVSFVTTTPDKFQFHSQIRLSQINVINPIRLKFKLYANFFEWGSRIYFLFMGRQDIVNYWDFPPKISRNCHKRLVPKITRHVYWEMFVKMSLRDRLICFADFVGMTVFTLRFLLPPCYLSAAPFTQLFSQSLSSHTLCSCLDNLCTNNNLCNFWHRKFQQISTYAFCSWDDVFTQKWNCSSPNNLCKCTNSSSTLSTNFLNWNFYLSWSNQLGTSFRLEMNVGSFSEHQNKTTDTNRYRWYFFTARVSQVNVITMKRTLEQRSELQVAKCLIVHVLSSRYSVSRLELRNKRKALQQWNFCVANDTVLN